MIPLLAQVSADPMTWNMKTFVDISPLVAVVVMLVFGLRKPTVTITDQPIIVDLKKEFISKEEARALREEIIREQNKLEQRMTNLERKLDSDKDDIIKAGQDRSRAIHERIDKLVDGFGQVTGELKRIRTT